MTTTIELPPMATYQLEAIFCDQKSSIIEASTKSGKTFGCIVWLLSEALDTQKYPKGKLGFEYWWVAPVHDQARIAYDRTKNLLTQTDPAKEIWKSNDTEKSISLQNGATLRFKSAEKPDNLYGEDVYAAVYDEASRGRQESWWALQSTLTATDGKVRVIGNVRGRKNWAYLLARKVQAGALPSWNYRSINALDAVKAGVLKQSVIDERKAVLPDHIFRELYYNEPSEDGGNPFGLQHIAACTKPTLSTKPPRVFGVDLAKSVDWTVVEGLDEDLNPCVFERWQHEPWDHTANRILSIVGDKPTLVDSTGVGDPIVETLSRKAPNIEGFKFTNQTKQQLFEGLALKIQSHGCGILEGVERQEHESFEYNTERARVFYSAPDGFHDDTVCAKALAVEKARAHIPVTAGIVNMGQPPPPPPDERDIRVIITEKRADLNWGWEGHRNGDRVTPQERYRR
jgi:hypothetical protein